MASPAPLSSRILFRAFELDAATGELRKSGIPVKLRLQAMQVLVMLTERAGHVVSRDEIRQRLWSADTFVDFERGINFCINQIRAALGDDAEKPRYVETLPRRGYRFIAPVTLEVLRERPIVSLASHLNESQPPTAIPAISPASSGIQVVSRKQSKGRASHRTRKRLIPVVGFAFLCLAGAYGTRTWRARSRMLVLQDVHLTQLTHSGAVTGVAISPDARYLLYSKLEGRKQGLWIHQIAAHSDVQLLPAGPAFHGLTVSPDGNYTYFLRSDDHNDAFKYLYSMPLLGGPVKKLFTDVDSPASFSPDGRQFAFEHCVEGRDDIELRVANVGASEDRVLAVIHHATSLIFQPGPAWSPDGRSIALPVLLVGPRSDWALEVVTIANGSVRELFSRHNSDPIGRPVWWRDDTLLVPLYEAAGLRGQLWTISYPGGKSARFTNDLTSYGADDDNGFPLDRSRDGKDLVALATTRTAKVWMADATTRWTARQVSGEKFPLFGAAQAGDGTIWAINGNRQLTVSSPDGGQAPSPQDYHELGSLAACGPYMLVVHSEGGLVTLTRLDPDGKHPKDLATGSLGSPFCSPDAKFVYYGTAQLPQKIWRLPIDGGVPVEIATVLGDQVVSTLGLSPDGTLICYAYTKYGPSLGWYVAAVPVDGGPPRANFPLQMDGYSLAFSPDGSAFQYLLKDNDATNIWEQSLSGSKPKQITRFPSGVIFDFSYSFDRKRLLITRGEINSDAVLLSNNR